MKTGATNVAPDPVCTFSQGAEFKRGRTIASIPWRGAVKTSPQTGDCGVMSSTRTIDRSRSSAHVPTGSPRLSSDPTTSPAALEAQLLLDTFRGIDLGVVWLDDEARVVLANAFFAGWLARDPAALVDRPLAELVDGLSPHAWEALRAPPDAVRAAARLAIRSADGRRRVLEVRARAVHHDGRDAHRAAADPDRRPRRGRGHRRPAARGARIDRARATAALRAGPAVPPRRGAGARSQRAPCCSSRRTAPSRRSPARACRPPTWKRCTARRSARAPARAARRPGAASRWRSPTSPPIRCGPTIAACCRCWTWPRAGPRPSSRATARSSPPSRCTTASPARRRRSTAAWSRPACRCAAWRCSTRPTARRSSAWRTSTRSPACPTGACSATVRARRCRWRFACRRPARCCCSTSTASRRPTTRWATAPATRCCARRRGGCRPRSATAPPSRAWAATSSRPCCRAAARSRRCMRPSACATRWPRRCASRACRSRCPPASASRCSRRTASSWNGC